MANVDLYAHETIGAGSPAEAEIDTGRGLSHALRLLPPGRMWPRHAGTNLHGLLQGLARSGERIRSLVTRLLAARDPRESWEHLPIWEDLLGVPDADGTAVTLGARQAACYERLTSQGDTSPDSLIATAAALGYAIDVRFAVWSVVELGAWYLDEEELGWDGAWDYLEIFTTTGADDHGLRRAIDRLIPGHMLAVYTITEA